MQNGDCTFADAEFTLSDHNVEFSFENADCTMDTLILPDLPNETFELVQVHLHSGTEHTFDGFFNAAEMHMVHKSTGDSGMLAVVGVILQAGISEEHFLFRKLLNEWDTVQQEVQDQCFATGRERNLNVEENKGTILNSLKESINSLEESKSASLNIYDILPEDEAFYRYEGGLTTPPCTEIVHWSVASKPVQISTTQERELANLILNYVGEDCVHGSVASTGGSTSRPPQPLNGRTVDLICPASFENENVGFSGALGNTMALTTAAAAGLAAMAFA